MKKFITNLEDKVSSVLNESLVTDAAELLGIEEQEAEDRITGLSFANYIELGNAIDMEDAETVREILGSVAPLEEDWKKAAAIGTMALGLGAAAADQGSHTTAADDPSWDGPHDVQVSTQRSVDQDDNLTDRSLSVKGPNANGEYLVTYLDGEEIKRYVTTEPPADRNPKQLESTDEWNPGGPDPMCDNCGGEGAIEQGGKSYNCPQCNSGALEERGTVDEERLLDKPTPTLKDLAKKHDMPLADMGIQLAKGIKIEKEHTSDMLVAKEIALDHLNELPDYYDRLEKMEEAKPASNAKNYVRKGGNNEQYKWKVTLNNGKSKTVWADSRKQVKDSLGTSELIIGIKSAKKIAETSGAGGTGAGAVGGGASVGVGAAGDIGTWDGKKQKKQKGNTKDTGKGVYEGDDESWQDELRNKLDNMEKPDYSWAKKELYHVTRTEYVPGIQKNGLRPMGAPSNWVQQGNMERYGMGEVYVFTNKEDAKKWAGRMDWEFNQTIGSGNISIVTLNRPADHEFEKDESDPMSQAGAKGDWLKTYEPISPEYITGAQEFKSMKESDEEIIDFTDETCMECGQGTYVETSIFDDMDGVLHCSDCNHKVERYMPRNFVGKLLGEADNPYASAPSQGSSVDALAQQTKTAQPAKQAGDEEENNLQQRKDVDDLMVGDDIEVIDIDGDPTPVTVKTPRGPGDTVVVQTDKGEEHIVKKQAVSGTPTIEEMYEAALEEDNAYESALTDRVHEAYNANKTEHSGAKKGKGGYYGRKKDAKRDSNKKRRSNDKEAMKENWIEDMEAEDAETASFNEKEWSNLGFKQSSTWPTGVTLISMGDLRKNARAKFKQERWKRTEPEGGLSWFIHPEGKYMSVIEFQHGATTVTSMPVPSYMMGESFDPATHVSVEHRDPEGKFIIVHAPPAGYWAVGQGSYYQDIDRTSFKNFDDALEHAELCVSSMDESIDINEIRRLAGLKETASSGATGAGAIASAPTSMNGGDPVRRSIYDKPKPKKRTKESSDGSIGRAKK